MNAYVWQDTCPVSDNYHEDGGLLVVAPSLDEARADALAQLIEERGGYSTVDYESARWLSDDPTVVLDDVVGERVVIVFPNAGCC